MVVNIQRLANGQGLLAPQERAIKLPPGWTIVDHPLDSLAGVIGGPGEVTGYLELVPPVAAAFSTVTIPVPSLGTASLTNGLERSTSGTITTTNGTPAPLCALPFSGPGLGLVRVDVYGVDTSPGGGHVEFAIVTGSVAVSGGVLSTVDGAASPVVVDTVGFLAQAELFWSGGLLYVYVTGPSVHVVGITDVTEGALYGGGGTLDTLTLILNVNGGGLQTLTLAAAGNTATEAALLAAIHTKWPALTATAAGPGGNKLVLTGGATGSIIVGGGTATAALGLTPGTVGPDTMLWMGSMRVVGGA